MSLVEKFFEADLSEAEADQLEALLASSPEAAEQMAALAERDYAATGLPTPVREEKKSKKFLFWIIGATLLAAGAGAWLLSSDEAPVNEAQEESASFQEGALAPEPVAPVVHHARPQPPTESEPRVSAPIRPQANDQHRLGLHVDGAEAGLLKVLVYNATGTCVRHIYEGPISKGPHKLSWDGSLDSGARAAHGRYVIEVQSKAGVSRQELKL